MQRSSRVELLSLKAELLTYTSRLLSPRHTLINICASLVASVVSDSATPWTIAQQAPLSIGFSRQDYWSGSPCPSPEDLVDPGIELVALMSPASAGGFFTTRAT